MDLAIITAVAGSVAGTAAGAWILFHRLDRSQRHGRLLAVALRSAQRLASGDLAAAIRASLSEIGPELHCRAVEWHAVAAGDGGIPHSTLVCDWVDRGRRSRTGDPLHQQRSWHPERTRWLAELAVGRPLAGLRTAVPVGERALFDNDQALLLIPVRTGLILRGVLWAAGDRRLHDGTALAALDLLAEQIGSSLIRQEATAALAAAEHRAGAGERSKREFLANISHELRTPLNGIVGLAGLLAEDDLTPRQQEYAQVVRSSAENLHTLINDLLAMAGSGGDRPLDPVRFDPLRLAEDVVALHAESAHAKGLEIAVEPTPGLPQRLVCDLSRVRQALVNLVGNGIKFTTNGHVLVRVGWLPAESAGRGERLELVVVDTGIGMDVDTRNRIFADFTQGDGAANRRYGGTGIGLAITRRQVEALGGTITCTSVPGQGSVFTLRIPATSISSQGSGRATQIQARLRGIRVLVVEPHPMVRVALQAICQHLGLRPEAVSGCAEATARLHSHQADPELVLVSANMPGALDLPGMIPTPEGAHRIWILLAGAARRPSRSDTTARGFATCLGKPPRSLRLGEAIRRALDDQESHYSDHTVRAVRLAPLRILVVDPDPARQRLIRLALDSEGIRADLVASGHEAIAAKARIHYDAVILATAGPENPGIINALRECELIHSHAVAPIIGLRDRAGALDGLDAQVLEPIDPGELLRTINAVIRISRRVG